MLSKLRANALHFALFPVPIENLDEFFGIIDHITGKAPSDIDLYQGRTLDNRTPFAFLASHPSLQFSEATKNTSSSAQNKVEFNVRKFYGKTNDKDQILVAFDMIAQRCRITNFDHLKCLINDRSHGNSLKYQLLHIACRHDNSGLLKWLLQFPELSMGLGEHKDADYTPLLTATFYSSKGCIDVLLQKVRH